MIDWAARAKELHNIFSNTTNPEWSGCVQQKEVNMTTEQYQIGYEEGYQEGWNAAMDEGKVASTKKSFSLHLWNNGNAVVWPKFLPEFKSKTCKHEDDGFCYTSNPPKYKCKICGEFFRNQQDAAKAAPGEPESDAVRQERTITHAKYLFANLKPLGEQQALNEAIQSVWASAFSHGFQCGREREREAASQQEAQEPAHPSCKSDTTVNGGALKLALNVLRRAGKTEVADELEKTAQPAPAPLSGALGPLKAWWAMQEAQWELCEETPADDAVILHFMGSGASTMVTAGQMRAALAAQGCK